MSTERYVIEPLADHYDHASFACGVAALDRYLHRQAGQNARWNLAFSSLLP